MAPLQIIGAGTVRTGNDSLCEALNTLGYHAHQLRSMFVDPEQNVDDFYNAAMNNGKADWDRIYANYNVALGTPSSAFYKELMIKYPDAKVILTVRDADSWYKSVKNTIFARQVRSPITNEHFRRFRRMTDAIVFSGALTDVERFEKEIEIKKMYLEHNEEVIQYVPTDRLYVMLIGEGWEGLCKFLDKDVPIIPYPNLNTTEEYIRDIHALRQVFLDNQQ